MAGEDLYELVEALERLYVLNRDRYVIMKRNGDFYVPKVNGKPQALSREMLAKHLRQELTLGVYAAQGESKFFSLDVDTGRKEDVLAIMHCLSTHGISKDDIHVSASGGKGYHVELFFDKPVDSNRLRNFYNQVLSCCGLNRHEVEFRPTAGMAIKLPLSIHTKTGRVCWFLDQDTLEPICTSDYLLRMKPISAASFSHYLMTMDQRSIKNMDQEESEAGTSDSPMLRKDYPVDVSRFTMLKGRGTRHNTMLRIAAACRNTGADKKTCCASLQKWYRQQNPDFICSSHHTVMQDIDAIVDWTYSNRYQFPTQTGQPYRVAVTVNEMLCA